MNPVVHFGMPAEDRKRMSDFYAKVFGWQTKQFGSEMGNYVFATTTESDERNTPKKPGAINGGFFTKTAEDTLPKVTIQVEDIQEAMRKIEAAGGKILGAVQDMPGLAKFVNFQDTEGNRVALMQPAGQ